MRQVIEVLAPRRSRLVGPALPPSDLLTSDEFAAFLEAQDTRPARSGDLDVSATTSDSLYRTVSA